MIYIKEKYAIIGSHGVGKSTAAYSLACRLKKESPEKSIKVIEELVRKNSKLVGLNNKNFQKISILDSIYKQILHSSLNDVIICDRIALDYYIYGEYFNINIPEEYKNLSIENAKEFNKVYFIRPDETPISDDGFRFLNVKERNEIDSLFKKILIDNGILHEDVSSKDVFT